MIRKLKSIGSIRQVFSNPGNKRKIYIFLICLFCSSFFWLFIKLSREAQADFEQHVIFVNVPSDVVISQMNHSSVRYTVQSTGARLLADHYFSPPDTLFVDARAMGRKAIDGDLWHFISPGQIRAGLTARLDGTQSLVAFWPDTLFVKMAYAAEKKVPVRLNASLSFVQRFGQYGPVVITPDSVMVRGPRQLVDTLQFIDTEPLVFENLSQNAQQAANLVNPAFSLGLTVTPTQIELFIPVEEFTEISVELPLQVVCSHADGGQHRNVRLFPNTVTVTCLVSLKDYARVAPSLFSAHVLCPTEIAPGSNSLEVIVGAFPDFVKIQNIRPATVEFLIME